MTYQVLKKTEQLREEREEYDAPKCDVLAYRVVERITDSGDENVGEGGESPE